MELIMALLVIVIYIVIGVVVGMVLNVWQIKNGKEYMSLDAVDFLASAFWPITALLVIIGVPSYIIIKKLIKSYRVATLKVLKAMKIPITKELEEDAYNI